MSREGEEEEEGEEREEADLLSADRLRRPAGLEKRNSRYNQWNRHVINTFFYFNRGKNIWKVSTRSTMLVSWRVKNLCGGYTVKKLSFFPSPAGMSLTKLSLAGNS
jgi:hypothetical protein